MYYNSWYVAIVSLCLATETTKFMTCGSKVNPRLLTLMVQCMIYSKVDVLNNKVNFSYIYVKCFNTLGR